MQALAKMGKKTVKLILHLKGMDLTKLLVDDQGGSRINNITSERTARSLLTRLWEKIMSGYRAGDGKV